MVARADLQVTLTAIDRATPTVKQLESSIIRFVGAVSATIAALGAITFPITQATRFDRALRDVQKTTGFADDEIKQLGNDLIGLSRGLDQSALSLAGIAAAAGQLGLGREGAGAILAFSESVARASTTLDLSTDAAARASAKLLNIFQLPTQNVENLFSAINELSNTTTANAGELIDTVTRIGNTAKLAVTEVAALAATAIDLGVSAEVAGTSLVKVFSRIQSNAQGFADAIGVSLSEFTALPALDRFQAFLSFLSTQTDEVQANLITKLAGGGRIFALVNKLVNDAGNDFAVLNRNLTTANTAFDSGLSAITEYRNISKALTVQLGILRNNFSALTISVGQQFIPRLLQLTRELTEFLQTPRAQAFFRGIGESARSFFDVMVNGVRIIADLDIEFRNLFAILKLIAALQFGRLLLGITARLAQTLINLTGIGRAATLARGPLSGLITTFQQFSGATGSAAVGLRAVRSQVVGGLFAAFSRFGQLLLRFIPVVGIITLALGGIFAVFGDEIKKTFNAILEFFGFVSEEQGKLLDDAKKQLDEDVVAFDEAAATVLQARKKLESGALDLPKESFASIIENDILKLNDAVLIAQERIKTLGELSEAAATRAALFARASERFRAAAEAQLTGIAAAEREVVAARARLAELEGRRERQDEEEPIDLEGIGASVTVSRQELAAATLALAEAEKVLFAEEAKRVQLLNVRISRDKAAQEATIESVTSAIEQAQIFKDIAGGLTAGLIQGFQLEIRTRGAVLELADVEQRLGELRGQLATASAIGGGDPLVTAGIQSEIDTLTTSVEIHTAKVLTATEKTKEFVDQLTTAEQFEFSRHLANLAKTEEGLKQTRIALSSISPVALESSADLEEAFTKNVISIVRTKQALEDVKKTQDEQLEGLIEVAKAAKSVFDNTVTEVRALNRALIANVEEFRISLANRPLELKIKLDVAELEAELGTIEDRREELEKRLTEIAEQENDSRLQGVFTFEKNKTKAELEALTARQAALEQQQAQDQERRLRAEFAAVEARTRDFIARAQVLASEGRLDEALGLKELAKQQLPDLFEQLNQLSGLTTAGGDPLVRTEELERLVGQIQRISRDVQGDVTDINEALRDSTDKELKLFEATAKVTNENLAEVNAQLELMGKNIEGFNDALPDILKLVREGTRVTGSGGTAAQVRFNDPTALALQAGNLIDAAAGRGVELTAGEDLGKTAVALGDAADSLRRLVAFQEEFGGSIRIPAGAGGQASGGLIRGRGTGTSDSIPAMLSNGEFIINAATTRFFGSNFFSGLQKFARGGLTVPRFGVGGLVGGIPGFEPVIQAAGAGGAPVNIHLPSGDVVRLREGQTDSQTVIRMFRREARKRGTRGA